MRAGHHNRQCIANAALQCIDACEDGYESISAEVDRVFFWPLPRSRADIWPVTPLNAILSMTHNYLVADRPSSQNTGLT